MYVATTFVCSEYGGLYPRRFHHCDERSRIVVTRVVVTHRCHYFVVKVVPLRDSASISMLSYSQRHYDIYF